MLNNSDVHYRKVKFWFDKKLITSLLKEKIKPLKYFNDKILLYGLSINKIKRGR